MKVPQPFLLIIFFFVIFGKIYELDPHFIKWWKKNCQKFLRSGLRREAKIGQMLYMSRTW